jgi:hypothetical protein
MDLNQLIRSTLLFCLIAFEAPSASAQSQPRTMSLFLRVDLSGGSVVSPWPKAELPNAKRSIGDLIIQLIVEDGVYQRFPWTITVLGDGDPDQYPLIRVAIQEFSQQGVLSNWELTTELKAGPKSADFKTKLPPIRLLPEGDLQNGLAPAKSIRPMYIARSFVEKVVQPELGDCLKQKVWEQIPIAKGKLLPGDPLGANESLVLLSIDDYRFLGSKHFRMRCELNGVNGQEDIEGCGAGRSHAELPGLVFRHAPVNRQKFLPDANVYLHLVDLLPGRNQPNCPPADTDFPPAEGNVLIVDD